MSFIAFFALLAFGIIILFGIIAGVFGEVRRNRRLKDIQKNTDKLPNDLSEFRKELADLKEQIAELTIKLDNLNF